MLYSTPTLLLKYLHYYWVAANAKGHGIHSPFVFKFIQEIFQGDVAQLESLIQYIDEEAEAETWMQALLSRYQAYRQAENEAIWEELHQIIERKFN